MKQIIRIISLFILAAFLPVGMAIQASNDNDNKIVKIVELKNYKTSIIKGEVVKILDEDEFRIQDNSGKIKVYTGWKNTNTVSLGEKVMVKGYQDPGLIKEFYASEITRENGEKILLDKD
ncbi:MAG: hypothetical protein ACP5E3_01595 [Bacteroidales bacterium]